MIHPEPGVTILVGDMHGRLGRLTRLVDRFGEDASYLFLGDFYDRSAEAPDAGHQVVRRVMALPNARALAGNHEALILSALREQSHGPDPQFRSSRFNTAAACWVYNGGSWGDLRALADDPEAIAWLHSLDFMTRVGDTLVQHSDTTRYMDYADSVDGGDDLDAINRALRSALRERPWKVFVDLLDRCRFMDEKDGTAAAHAYLARFDAARLVHGHSAHHYPQPFVYAGGRCIDIDSRKHDEGAWMVLGAGPLARAEANA